MATTHWTHGGLDVAAPRARPPRPTASRRLAACRRPPVRAGSPTTRAPAVVGAPRPAGRRRGIGRPVSSTIRCGPFPPRRHPAPGEHPARGPGAQRFDPGPTRGCCWSGSSASATRGRRTPRATCSAALGRRARRDPRRRCAPSGPGRAPQPERRSRSLASSTSHLAARRAAHHRGRGARRPLAGRAPRGARARGPRRVLPRQPPPSAAAPIEMPSRATSVPGMRLFEALRRRLLARGGRIQMGISGRRRGARRRPDHRHPHRGRVAHPAPGRRRVRARHRRHRRRRHARHT